jgi:hypothetical protein
MPQEYTPQNQPKATPEVSATLFQDGQTVANGSARVKGKRVTFYPSEPVPNCPVLRPPITLKLLDSHAVHKLRQAQEGHEKCSRHWDFEIADD